MHQQPSTEVLVMGFPWQPKVGVFTICAMENIYPSPSRTTSIVQFSKTPKMNGIAKCVRHFLISIG